MDKINYQIQICKGGHAIQADQTYLYKEDSNIKVNSFSLDHILYHRLLIKCI